MAGSEPCRWATMKDGKVSLEEASEAVQTVLRVYEDALQKAQAEKAEWIGQEAALRNAFELDLERRDKEIAGLRAALEPFAVDLTFLGKVRDECRIDVNVPVSAVRAAHAALQTIRETNRGNAPQSPPSEGGEDESHL